MLPASHQAQPARTLTRTRGAVSTNVVVGWLLLIPVLTLALLAPTALGADAANRAGTALTEPMDGLPSLPDGDPAELSLLDYASRAVFDADYTEMRDTDAVNGAVIPYVEVETADMIARPNDPYAT